MSDPKVTRLPTSGRTKAGAVNALARIVSARSR
jgi:hypothetical protein